MKNGFFLVFLLSYMFPMSAAAIVRPVFSIATGADVVHLTSNQNLSIISPYYNTYHANNIETDFAGGVFIGLEEVLSQYFSAEIGLSYYQNTGYQENGYVYQFGDESLANLKYQYNIVSRRLFIESKLLAMGRGRYHPFFSIGLGESANKAEQYTETPVSSADLPMSQGFENHTTHSFAYMLGLGVDMDVTDHTRLGVLYRFANLGYAQLNTTPLSDTGDFLKSNQIHINEFFIQFTYLG